MIRSHQIKWSGVAGGVFSGMVMAEGVAAFFFLQQSLRLQTSVATSVGSQVPCFALDTTDISLKHVTRDSAVHGTDRWCRAFMPPAY